MKEGKNIENIKAGNNTKERILLTALRLFAREGYEAVSVSRISGELGMVKSALYKHYESKRHIFDSIVERMSQMDYERAREYQMPEGTIDEMAEAYRDTPLEKIITYSQAQFRHWTEEEFSSLFRKMLTLEQYRNKEMAKLYQQYLAAGPVEYMTDIFSSMTGKKEEAGRLALDFYAPIYLMYSLYDNAENKKEINDNMKKHVENFAKKLEEMKE